MQNQRNENTINVLVSKYEEMSQKGVVDFIEETVFGQLVDYYMGVQHSHKAVEVLQHAIEQHPYSAGFYIQYGEILIYNGLFEEALNALDQAAMFEPGSTKVGVLKVMVLMEMQNYEMAFALLQDIKPTANADSISKIYCLEAELQELRGNYGEMYYSLEAALNANPQNIEALEAMMWAVEMNGNYEESISLHKSIINQFPYSDNAWFNLGQAYNGIEAHALAAEAFEYVYIINPEHEYAYRECVQSLIKQKAYEKALDCYEDAVLHVTPDVSLLLDVGLCYESLSELNLAIQYYTNAIDISPQHEQAHYNLGVCYRKLNQFDKSIRFLKQAISINDRKEEYLSALADSFNAVGQIEEADIYHQKAADTAPEVSTYWVRYAIFLIQASQPLKALSLLEEAELYTDDVEIVYCRILCLLELGRKGEALYLLGDTLMSDYDKHSLLFEWKPELKKVELISKLLEKYNPISID